MKLNRIIFPVVAICAALIDFNNPALGAPHEVKQLKVTILSTMLADEGIGEWGFAALVEADGHLVLIDTGARPETVLQNAKELKVELNRVHDVVLTHFHSDHIGGLMTLRAEVKTADKAALGTARVTPAIFYSRPGADGVELNPMIALRGQFESSGGKFIEREGMNEIAPGVWLTGSIPRVFPERNWSGSGQVLTPAGLVEDNVPDDQSLIIETADGLVVITGCGHAGIVNILTAAKAQFHRNVTAVIGGLHLFRASDEQVDWTADKMRGFGVRNLIGAHCTGIESVYRIRQRMGLNRRTAVVGAVGATFTLTEGIRPGLIAQ